MFILTKIGDILFPQRMILSSRARLATGPMRYLSISTRSGRKMVSRVLGIEEGMMVVCLSADWVLVTLYRLEDVPLARSSGMLGCAEYFKEVRGAESLWLYDESFKTVGAGLS